MSIFGCVSSSSFVSNLLSVLHLLRFAGGFQSPLLSFPVRPSSARQKTHRREPQKSAAAARAREGGIFLDLKKKEERRDRLFVRLLVKGPFTFLKRRLGGRTAPTAAKKWLAPRRCPAGGGSFEIERAPYYYGRRSPCRISIFARAKKSTYELIPLARCCRRLFAAICILCSLSLSLSYIIHR